MKDKKFVYGILIPCFFLLFVFCVFPLFYGLGISLFDYNPIRLENPFIGLQNYAALLEDEDFKNALILAVAKLPYTVLMAAVIVAAVIASLWSTFTLMFALPLWLMIGGALIAWVNSYILRRVFVIFEGSESAAEEENKG